MDDPTADDLKKDEEENIINPLDLSDDDFLNGDHDFDPADSVEDPDPDTDTEDPDESTAGTDTPDEPDEDADPEDDDSSDPEDDDGSDVDDDDDTSDPDDDTDTADDDTKALDGQDDDTKTDDSIDYKAEYEKLLAPFRANNRDMTVNSVEEAKTLMSMGANYVKKMSAIKPNLKYIKMLDNNGLLDEAKLSFYIDLDKKDPAAIQKFIKDSGIDPLDINVKDESSYKQNTAHVVDDKEVELDGILEELQDTESFQDTIDIIGKNWDSESRGIIANEPEIIRVLNGQVASGVFKKIAGEVDRRRMLGELKGVSDIAAYKQVGDMLANAGAFNTAPASDQPTTVNKPSKSKKQVDDTKLKSRKKAASSTKGSTSSKKVDYNPLSMSDEEFEAMDEKLLNYK